MILESEHLKLRALEPEDLELLYEWENDTRIWIHGNSLSPYSKLTLRQYISDARIMDIYQAKQLRLMITIKMDNMTIGTIDLYDFDIRNRRMGLGILIDERYRRKNYASETLEIIKEYAFSFLGIHQLYAYISSDNKGSIKLFTRAGFSKSGTLKEWIHSVEGFKNVYIFQLIGKKSD